jgi:predicted transcriptional regulator
MLIWLSAIFNIPYCTSIYKPGGNMTILRFTTDQALVYLQQLDLVGKETSLNELKEKWGWDSHTQVLRYLRKLEKQGIIIKTNWNNGTKNSGTRVYFQPACVIV